MTTPARAPEVEAVRADAETRRIAQREFERPLLVEAGAGTGKTSVLVARVVAWCCGPGWERAAAAVASRPEPPTDAGIAGRVLDRVVAITFTEAAAAEMEERTAEALRCLGGGDVEAGWPVWIDRDALPPCELLRDRARSLLGAFDRLRVSTIHAFCRRLLGEHPLEAGVHPRFAVDARGLARSAAAREAVEGWLSEAARAEDPDLVDLVDDGVAGPELEAMLDPLLAAAVPVEEFAADPLSPERIEAFVVRLRETVEGWLAAEAEGLARLSRSGLGRQVRDAAANTRVLLDRTPRDREGLGRLVDGLRAAWPANLRRRLGEFAGGRFTSAREDDELGERRAAVSEASARLAPLLEHACGLDPERIARVHRVLAPLHARAAARMRRGGQESFDALLRRARALLERHGSVLERVRARIDQLLVDEFQDTDAAQSAIVARLALEGRRGPGLFVVGDPKQSIYGWRSADLEAYEAFRARLVAAGGRVHPLSVNHRSTPALLEEVARAMHGVMRETPGVQPRFEALVAARAAPDRPAPAVEYWVSSDRAELAAGGGAPVRTRAEAATAREAARLAADLWRLAREAGDTWKWRDVAILLRATGDAETYLEALREAGIPCTFARDRRYQRRREVAEARALVRAVLDPSDQIALVGALRSAWAGVPDAAWLPLWRRGFPAAVRGAFDGRAGARERLAVIARESAAALRARAGVPGLAALEGWDEALLHALDVLVALRRLFEREPAERFVEALRTLPLLEATEAARFLGPWRLANLDRFFRELGAALEDASGDVASVLRALRRDEGLDVEWEEGRPQHPSGDAVQVMTIHGAKGLEFEHVYLVQLHRGAGRHEDPAFEAGAEALAGEWVFGSPRVASLGFDRVRVRRRCIEEAERVRTLYVAMTRARRRLVLAGHWSERARQGAHGSLLAASRGAAQQAALGRGLASGPAWNGVVDDAEGVRWVFLDRAAPGAAEAAPPARPAAGPDLARARADSTRLAAARLDAEARAGRALVAPATAGSADERREAHAADPEAEPGRPRAPGDAAQLADLELAAAVGTAIHEALERFDWSDEAASWARTHAQVAASVAARLDPAGAEAATARARALLERVARGRLWARLRALAPAVVARELPVLIAPEPDAGPVGAGIGKLDLLYREPETGEWVIADFKTDRVDREEAVAAKVARYIAQGRAYQRAVRQALALPRPPRFELWLLEADRIERVDP